MVFKPPVSIAVGGKVYTLYQARSISYSTKALGMANMRSSSSVTPLLSSLDFVNPQLLLGNSPSAAHYCQAALSGTRRNPYSETCRPRTYAWLMVSDERPTLRRVDVRDNVAWGEKAICYKVAGGTKTNVGVLAADPISRYKPTLSQ
jgi:hypothetical protein